MQKKRKTFNISENAIFQKKGPTGELFYDKKVSRRGLFWMKKGLFEISFNEQGLKYK